MDCSLKDFDASVTSDNLANGTVRELLHLKIFNPLMLESLISSFLCVGMSKASDIHGIFFKQFLAKYQVQELKLNLKNWRSIFLNCLTAVDCFSVISEFCKLLAYFYPNTKLIIHSVLSWAERALHRGVINHNIFNIVLRVVSGESILELRVCCNPPIHPCIHVFNNRFFTIIVLLY